MKQVNQKLISFKVDKDVLISLDYIVSLCDGRLIDDKPVRVNRNKFINLALSFAVEAVLRQLDYLSRTHKDDIMPGFI